VFQYTEKSVHEYARYYIGLCANPSLFHISGSASVWKTPPFRQVDRPQQKSFAQPMASVAKAHRFQERNGTSETRALPKAQKPPRPLPFGTGEWHVIGGPANPLLRGRRRFKHSISHIDSLFPKRLSRLAAGCGRQQNSQSHAHSNA